MSPLGHQPVVAALLIFAVIGLAAAITHAIRVR